MVSEEAHVFVGVKLALSYLSFFQLEGTRALLSSHLHLLRVALFAEDLYNMANCDTARWLP